MKHTLKWLVTIGLLFAGSSLYAAKVDTVLTYSDAMKKQIKAVIVTPDAYSKGGTFPVLYLLHGAGGNYAEWVKKAPDLVKYADQYQMLIVCADGNVTSWYFDSPVDEHWKYETYVSSELVKYMDSHYKTIATKKGRAISGLSMGGHGALYLAIKHQDVFGAAGSMSGGVDLKPFPNNWDIAKRLGPLSEFPERWKQNSVVDLVYLIKPKSLAITIECGTSDFFYNANLKLHEELSYYNVPHDFTSRPGAHTWDFWVNAIKYQSLFFSDFFNGKTLN